MFRPLELQLTPVNESILLDNLDIFCRNGFQFLVDLNGKETSQFLLLFFWSGQFIKCSDSVTFVLCKLTFIIIIIIVILVVVVDNPLVVC